MFSTAKMSNIADSKQDNVFEEKFTDQIKNMMDCLDESNILPEIQRYRLEQSINKALKTGTVEQVIEIAIFFSNPDKTNKTKNRMEALFNQCLSSMFVDRWDVLKKRAQEAHVNIISRNQFTR